MPSVQGINISELVSPEVLTEFIVSCPFVKFSGKLGEKTWNQKMYSIDRSIDMPYPNIFLASQGLSQNDATLVEQYINVPVQDPIAVMFPYNAYDEIFTFGGPNNNPKIAQGFTERISMPIAEGIKAKLESFIMDDCNASFYQTVGTAGTAISSYANISPASALWTRLELPKTDRMIIMSPESYQSLGAGLTVVLNPSYTGPILKELNIPSVAGWGIMESEYVTKHIYGDVVGTNNVLNSVTVATTMVEGSNQLVLTVPADVTINVGDLFSVAGVVGLSPRAKQPLGLMGFVSSTTVTTAPAATTLTVVLPINLYASATNSQRNVVALPQAGASVTFKAIWDAAEANYTCTKNYAVIPDSTSLISLRMPDINGANNSESVEPKTRMRMHVATQGVIDTYVNRIRVDLAAVWKAFPPYGVVLLS